METRSAATAPKQLAEALARIKALEKDLAYQSRVIASQDKSIAALCRQDRIEAAAHLKKMNKLEKENADLKAAVAKSDKIKELEAENAELKTQNAALRAVLRTQNNPEYSDDSYERPLGMSDREYRAYSAFRNERAYTNLYPGYTEMTIAPIEQQQWEERLEEMRDDGLWDDSSHSSNDSNSTRADIEDDCECLVKRKGDSSYWEYCHCEDCLKHDLAIDAALAEQGWVPGTLQTCT